MSETAFDRFVVPGYLDADGKFIPATGVDPIPVAPAQFNISTATNAGIAVTQVASTPLHLDGVGNTYILSNTGTKTAFVAIGGAGVTVDVIVNGAVGGGYPIPGGAIETISVTDGTDSYVTAICLSGETTTLYVSQGSGG